MPLTQPFCTLDILAVTNDSDDDGKNNNSKLFTLCFLGVYHCSEHLTNINSIFHKNLRKHYHFVDGEMEVQTG